MEIIISKDLGVVKQAQAIRHQVFTLEQDIPQELDIDGLDTESIHALVIEKSVPIATARLTINKDGSSVMARVAVMEAYRGLGIASKVVSALIEHAGNIGANSIIIHAHNYLRSYYEKFGFQFIREVEIVGEHQLIEMQQVF